MFEEIVTQYGSSEPIQSSNNSIMSDKSDKKIVISFPLLMRIMEWCHEDAKDDVELHKVMEKLIAFNDGINPLTIDVYDCLIDGVELSNTSEFNDLVEPMKAGCFSEYDMSDAVNTVKKSYDEMKPLVPTFSWEQGLDDNSTIINLNNEDCSNQAQEIDSDMEKEIQNLINLSKL